MTKRKFIELKPEDWFEVDATHGGVVRLIRVISEGTPEPDVFYRNEYGDSSLWWRQFSQISDRAKDRPYLGYTIRRVWADGRGSQVGGSGRPITLLCRANWPQARDHTPDSQPWR